MKVSRYNYYVCDIYEHVIAVSVMYLFYIRGEHHSSHQGSAGYLSSDQKLYTTEQVCHDKIHERTYM